MTGPSEPSVEASGLSDALKRDLRAAISHSSSACESWECVTCEALFRTVGKLLADHERAVRQARAEAWDEGWGVGLTQDRARLGAMEEAPKPNPYRTAQPEDPSALRAGGAG